MIKITISERIALKTHALINKQQYLKAIIFKEFGNFSEKKAIQKQDRTPNVSFVLTHVKPAVFGF